MSDTESVYAKWAKRQSIKNENEETHVCCCIGPINGEPVCPCRMRNVKEVDGRYIEINDLGPVSDTIKVRGEDREISEFLN